MNIKSKGSGSPTFPVCLGPEGFLGCGISSANTGTIPGLLGWLVTLREGDTQVRRQIQQRGLTMLWELRVADDDLIN